MDVFKFLDDAVRGAVAFVYGFARSMLTLIVHPIRGPTHLWAAHRDPSTKQISPITFLALSLVLVSFVGPAGVAADWNLPALAELARLLTTGSLSSGLVPTLGGAIVGTIVIDALLRAVGRWRFKGVRYERFVAILEYEIGLFITVGLPLMSVAADPSEESLGFYLGMIPFYVFAAVLALHFYSLLTRRPRYYAFARNLPRRFRRARKDGIKAWLRHLASFLRRPWPILRAVIVGYLRLLAGMFLVLPPILIVSLGTAAQTVTSNWLVAQQAPRAAVTLLDLRCDLVGTPGSVGGLAWNNSSKPALGWLHQVAIEIRDELGASYSLDWRPTIDPPRPTDLLMPGEAVQVRGEIVGSPRPAIDAEFLSNTECRAVGRSGAVQISSEGNAVRFPAAAR